MKTVKIILLAVLIFVTGTGLQKSEPVDDVSFSQLNTSKSSRSSFKPQASDNRESHTMEPLDPKLVEAELLRMISPNGSEVVFSLSQEVMGRTLETTDFKISGIEQTAHSALCQKTLSSKKELERAELKLELDLMIEELTDQKKPRFLTDLQTQILQRVPHCEMFKLQLTAISKMMRGYDYSEIAMRTIK